MNRKLAIQLYDSEHAELFEELASKTKVPASFIAATLTETLVNLSRLGFDTSRLSEDTLKDLFHAVNVGRISKEAVPEVLEAFLKGDVKNLDEAIVKLSLITISDQELECLIDKLLAENLDLIREKGDHAFSALMGQVMKTVRGKVDGLKVSQKLRQKLGRALTSY